MTILQRPVITSTRRYPPLKVVHIDVYLVIIKTGVTPAKGLVSTQTSWDSITNDEQKFQVFLGDHRRLFPQTPLTFKEVDLATRPAGVECWVQSEFGQGLDDDTTGPKDVSL